MVLDVVASSLLFAEVALAVAGPPVLVAPCALVVIWGSVAVDKFALSVPGAARNEALVSPGAVALGATDLIAFALPVVVLVVNSGDLVLVAPEMVAALNAVRKAAVAGILRRAGCRSVETQVVALGVPSDCLSVQWDMVAPLLPAPLLCLDR
jgi:hypothetical protein